MRVKFRRPNYRYILYLRAHWMCTKLPNRKWLKVRPANFLPFIVASPLLLSSSSIEVFVRASQQLVNFKKTNRPAPEGWCGFFSLISHCEAYVCRVAELPTNPWNLFYTTILHLASIRCTFLCCARSTSSPGQWPLYANIIVVTM